ncbi:hypothetical protein HK096_011219, partial [Nowakowskiella sp. JEL0078]
MPHVRRIYNMEGSLIMTLDQLEAGHGYVLVPNDEHFQQMQYNVNEITVHHTSAPLAGATMTNELMDKIRKPSQVVKWPKALMGRLGGRASVMKSEIEEEEE